MAGSALALSTGAAWPFPCAAASSAPTFALTSTVAGQPAPVPLYRSSGWQQRNGVWSLDLRMIAAPAGTTRVTVSWRSPVVAVRKGSWLFRDDIAVLHQGVDSDTDSDTVRICKTRSKRKPLCTDWISFADTPPNEISGPFVWLVVSTGGGWELKWPGAPAHAYVEWRASFTQNGTDEAHDVLQVAAGNAAGRVVTALPATCAGPNNTVCRPI